MSAVNIITFLGGLALFLYGVTLMGDGMKLLAGNKLVGSIRGVTESPVKALGVGAGMSAVIQSSSAVSIMAMGFVNTGLIRLRQALYIVLGSVFGTCVTGWIVCVSNTGSGGWVQYFSSSVIVGVISVIGIILRKFARSQSMHVVGDVLLGCGVLLLGITTMTASMQPLQNSEAFLSFLVKLRNPILGILIGIVFTSLIQSSAAAVATLQALALTGILTFSAAIPVLLGIAIGGALPVIIGALKLSRDSFRVALGHLLFDVIGVAVFGVIFYVINAIHPFAFMETPVTIVMVALLNTLLRLIMIIILTPMTGRIEKLTMIIAKDRAETEPEEKGELAMLDEHFLNQIPVAIAQSRTVVNSMACLVVKNVDDAMAAEENYSNELFNEVKETEALIDKYEDRLGSFLIKISRKQLSKKQNEDLYEFLHVITDLERISDHALNLAESAQEIHKKKIRFSPEAQHELSVLKAAVKEIVRNTINAFVGADLDAALRVEPLEEHIDNLCDALKHNHIDRLQNEECTLEHGFVFNDLLTNYERIGDHCSNIAVAMLEINNDTFDTHEYVDSRLNLKNEAFKKNLEEFKKKYSL